MAQSSIRKFATRIRNLHNRMPEPLRRWYAHPFRWRYTRSAKTFFGLRLPLYFFEGQERLSLHPMCMAYAGENKQNAAYWSKRILAAGFKKTTLGKFWTWSIPSTLKRNYSACSLVLIESNRLCQTFLNHEPGFTLPAWIHLVVDISPSMRELIRKSKGGFGDISRRIRKYKLKFEICHDASRFDSFYETMHKPTVLNRFAEAALFNTDQQARDIFARSDFFLISDTKEVIGGILIEYVDQQARLRILGVKDGDFQYVQKGVIGALYYYPILELQKKGHRELDIGGIHPILTDGLTRFKLALHPKIIPSPYLSQKQCRLILLSDSLSLRSFLRANPFMFYAANHKPHRAIFLDAHQFDSKEDLERFLRVTHCQGIERTHLYIMQDGAPLKDWIQGLSSHQYDVQPLLNILSSA